MSTVVSSKNGSMTAVVGSGIRIMSDSLMPFQPAIEEPSNILPSRNKSSSTSRAGMVTCCSLPRVSVKRRSANFASFSLISFRTSARCHIASGKVVMPQVARPGPGPCGMCRLLCQARAAHDGSRSCAAPDGGDALTWCVCARAHCTKFGASDRSARCSSRQLHRRAARPRGPNRCSDGAQLPRGRGCTPYTRAPSLDFEIRP